MLQDVADPIALVIDQEVTVFERRISNEYALFNPDGDAFRVVLPQQALTSLGQHRSQRRSANYHIDLAIEG